MSHDRTLTPNPPPPPQGSRSPQSRPPTPSAPPPPPVQPLRPETFLGDPFKELEWDRTHYHYSAENPNFEKIRLLESHIDDARELKEDLDSDRRRAAVLDEIMTFRRPLWEYNDDPKDKEMHLEYERQMHRFRRLEKGMTEEQIDDEDRAEEEERARKAREEQEAALRAGNSAATAPRRRVVRRLDIATWLAGALSTASPPVTSTPAASTSRQSARRVTKEAKKRSSRQLVNLPPEFEGLEREPKMARRRPATYENRNRRKVYRWRKRIVYGGVSEE